MPIVYALKAVTLVTRRVLDMNAGQFKDGMPADIIAVDGDATKDVTSLGHVMFVIRHGVV